MTGHTFGGGCPFSLAFDYRVMNAERGFFCMVAVDFGLYFPGIGGLVKAKLKPRVARKVLLEGHRFTSKEALLDEVVDVTAPADSMLEAALGLAEKWKSKAKGGVFAPLREELLLEAHERLSRNGSLEVQSTFQPKL